MGMNPSDPCFDIHACYYGNDPSDEAPGIACAVSNARATVQRRHADAWGGGFASVACVKRYVRMLTRQEVWTAARDYERDWQHMKYKIGYYAASAGYGPQGYYFDDTQQPVPSALIRFLEPPLEVPYGWRPHTEDVAAYEFVARDHPDAWPVWLCE